MNLHWLHSHMNNSGVFISHKHALWLGRFQPPSIGHLMTVLAILARWKFLTIGVVHRSNQSGDAHPKWESYLKNTRNVTQSLIRNPFQPEEVIAMFKATLDTQNIAHRVQFINMPQTAYQPAFNSIYPPEKYDFVDIALTSHDPETDYIRQKAFRDLLDRPVEYIRTPWKIHISQVRDRIDKGIGSWDEYIPKGGYEYFLSLNGPARMGGINLKK